MVNDASTKVTNELSHTGSPLQTLAKADKLIVTAERADDGKLRCTCTTWDDKSDVTVSGGSPVTAAAAGVPEGLRGGLCASRKIPPSAIVQCRVATALARATMG
jgi:hypothetical protein